MGKKEDKKDVLSHKYQSLKFFQYFLNLIILLEIIGGIFLFIEIQSDSSVIGSEKGLAVVFWFVLIGIGIWALLQTHKMIDFLFDLAEEKADLSHKH